jgi:hypothetical protein
LLALLLGWLAAAPPTVGEVESVVRDAAGAAVAGARVTFHAGTSIP